MAMRTSAHSPAMMYTSERVGSPGGFGRVVAACAFAGFSAAGLAVALAAAWGAASAAGTAGLATLLGSKSGSCGAGRGCHVS